MIIKHDLLRSSLAARKYLCPGAGPRLAPGILLAGILALGIVFAIAFSSPASVQAATTPVLSSAPAAEICRPLLRKADSTVPSPTNRSAYDLPGDEVGMAAALGLIFGVQYVTGPRESDFGGKIQKAVHSQKAVAVMAYRRCVNQKTLEAFNRSAHPRL